jgi:hypothetical protein
MPGGKLGLVSRARRATAAVLAVVLAASLLAACAAGSPSTARTVKVAAGLTVTFPDAAPGTRLPRVTSTPEPGLTGALSKPVHLDGHRYRGAIAVLAIPRHLEASGPLRRAGAVLSFRVNPDQVLNGSVPFLASLDTATGNWIPVASSYDPATGVVSARVTHFSVWAPLHWVKSAIAAVLKGALVSLFGLGGLGSAPSCSGQPVTVTDTRPDDGVGACAQASGDQVVAKIVNQRPYPVDLLYPPIARVQVPPADPFSQLGEDMNNFSSAYHDRVLLPGGAEADATLAIPAGQRAEFATEVDTEAYLLGIVGTGVQVLAKIEGLLGVKVAQDLLDALGQAKCLQDAVQTAQTLSLTPTTAENIGSTAFDCLAAVAKGLSDALLTLATLAASLIVELVAGIWGAIDSATGAANHELFLQRAALTPACSAGALFQAAVAGQHFNPSPSGYPPGAGPGPGAYDPHCYGGWAIAGISHPNVGLTDGEVLFRAIDGTWTYVAGVGGVAADCELEQLSVPASVAQVLIPPSQSAPASYCDQ